MSTKSYEGYVNFPISSLPTKETKTWYKVFGSLSARTPLVIVHGGPGCAHEYMLSLVDLPHKYSIPIVFYDQIGNGRSTHIPEKDGDIAFWTEDMFLDELDNLLTHLGIHNNYDLLGHSWGGMMSSRFASNRPKGMRRLIISDSPASMKLWVEAQTILRAKLSKDVQDILTKNEEDGTTDSKEYKDAMNVYYGEFMCRVKPLPQEVLQGLVWIEKDHTVYLTMNGPSEFYITGSLKTWSMLEDVHQIKVPTLLLNGFYDEAQDSVVTPFFKAIPQVKWVRFENSSHMPHWEERDRYMEVVADFLN